MQDSGSTLFEQLEKRVATLETQLEAQQKNMKATMVAVSCAMTAMGAANSRQQATRRQSAQMAGAKTRQRPAQPDSHISATAITTESHSRATRHHTYQLRQQTLCHANKLSPILPMPMPTSTANANAILLVPPSGRCQSPHKRVIDFIGLNKERRFKEGAEEDNGPEIVGARRAQRWCNLTYWEEDSVTGRILRRSTDRKNDTASDNGEPLSENVVAYLACWGCSEKFGDPVEWLAYLAWVGIIQCFDIFIFHSFFTQRRINEAAVSRRL